MPLFRALRRTIRYHLGSAAVGGFIIALVVAIRFILREAFATAPAPSPCDRSDSQGGTPALSPRLPRSVHIQ